MAFLVFWFLKSCTPFTYVFQSILLLLLIINKKKGQGLLIYKDPLEVKLSALHWIFNFLYERNNLIKGLLNYWEIYRWTWKEWWLHALLRFDVMHVFELIWTVWKAQSDVDWKKNRKGNLIHHSSHLSCYSFKNALNGGNLNFHRYLVKLSVK